MYTLIIVFIIGAFGGHNPVALEVKTLEFASQAQCEKAAVKVVRDIQFQGPGFTSVAATCVEK